MVSAAIDPQRFPELDETARPAGAAEVPAGIALAYEFVRPSYEMATRRFEAVEGRLRALLTFAMSLTVAAPVLVTAVVGRRELTSPWAIAAAVVFLLILALGFWGLLTGDIILLSPKVLHDGYADCDEAEFKRELLRFSGEHFERNRALVNRTGTIIDLVLGLLAAEVMCLVLWAALP